MFDEIFNRWIKTNQLTQDDIIPLFLEWNQEFGDKQATPEHVLILLQVFHTDYLRVLNHILKMIGIKRGYEWEEVYSSDGRLLTRFLCKNN